MAHTLDLSGNYDVLIVEKSNQLGAGVRTYWGHPFTFGPRHFLTKDKRLFDFFNKYVPMRDCGKNHRYLTYEKDNQFYSMPLSYDIENMPDKDVLMKSCNLDPNKKPKNLEEFWKFSIGNTYIIKLLMIIIKMMVDDNKVLLFWLDYKGDPIKKGKRDAFDSPDVFSAYPIAKDGYNAYFDIATKNAKVLLNTELEDCDMINKKLKLRVKITSLIILLIQ